MFRRLTFGFVALTVVTGLLFSFTFQPAFGQGEIVLKCGHEQEFEFTDRMQAHNYLLEMAPRETFTVSIIPAGEHLRTVISLYDSSGYRLGYTNRGSGNIALPMEKPAIASGVLSARGAYQIRVVNGTMVYDAPYNQEHGGIGLYTIKIECTNADGSPKVDDAPGAPTSQSTSAPQTAAPVTVETPTPESVHSSDEPLLAVGNTYAVLLASGAMLEIEVVKLRQDGWAEIEHTDGVSYLNVQQLLMITPVE